LTPQTSDGKAGRLKRCQVLDGKGLRWQDSAGVTPSEVWFLMLRLSNYHMPMGQINLPKKRGGPDCAVWPSCRVS